MRTSLAKILIAEDSPVNQKILLRMLNQIGYDADVVSNGSEAVVAVELISYDLVFMDVHMPVMDGIEATKKILSSRCDKCSPKIIALTADDTPDDRNKCIEVGMDDYITKPVKLEDVITVLKCWAHVDILPPVDSSVPNTSFVNPPIIYSIVNAG